MKTQLVPAVTQQLLFARRVNQIRCSVLQYQFSKVADATLLDGVVALGSAVIGNRFTAVDSFSTKPNSIFESQIDNTTNRTMCDLVDSNSTTLNTVDANQMLKRRKHEYKNKCENYAKITINYQTK